MCIQDTKRTPTPAAQFGSFAGCAVPQNKEHQMSIIRYMLVFYLAVILFGALGYCYIRGESAQFREYERCGFMVGRVGR